MEIGGSNNAAVAGINLTSAELARIFTTSSGTITIGDTNQTGNITLATATLATTAGASTVVVQSSTGAGQVILDDNSGAATALNANTGSVSIAAGTGGLVEAATNTTGTADIDGSASSVSLTSAGAIGSSSKALQLQSTSLTTNTSVNSSNQYLTALSPVTVSSFNAGAGAINLQGGVFTLAGASTINALTVDSGATFQINTTLTLAGADRQRRHRLGQRHFLRYSDHQCRERQLGRHWQPHLRRQQRQPNQRRQRRYVDHRRRLHGGRTKRQAANRRRRDRGQ